jgi:hypothetical protein
MTVAVQSLISEAYADPGTFWGDGTEVGKFFINGHYIGATLLLDTEYNDTGEDIYYMNLQTDPPDYQSVYSLSTLTKLSPYPEAPGSLDGSIPFPYQLLITRSGQIVASLYIDPSSLKVTEDSDWNTYYEGTYYTYNADIVTAAQIKYAPGAGYRLFKLSGKFNDPEITQL